MRKAGLPQLVSVGGAFAASLLVYLASRPSLPNGDGVGYLRAARAGDLAPGHPAFVPLVRLLGEPLLWRGQALSALCGAAVVALVCLRAGVRAAIALGLSWGLWASSSDLEVYAPALLCLWLAILTRHPAARGLFGGAAIALHLEHVLLLPFLLADAGAGAALLAAGGGAAAYAAAALFGKHLGPAAALRWVLSARHGFPSPLWKAPFGAVFGLSRTVIAAPYPYEAPLFRVVLQTALGAAALFVLARAARHDPRPLGRDRRALLLLVLPYAICGVLFFPSDQERWLFLLPLFFLWCAPALGRAGWLGLAGLFVLGLCNLAFGVLPLRDASGRERARAARQTLRPGDLVVGPGHGWDEYLDLEGPLPPQSQLFLLSFYAGRDGGAAALAEARQAAGRARRVVLLRFLEDADPQGWKELDALGLPRVRVRSALGGGELERLAPGVYAVVPPGPRSGRAGPRTPRPALIPPRP